MKYRTTAKAIRNNFKVFAAGYCGLQNLLEYTQPNAYTAGVYGWNADVYEFGGIAIVTGYRPFGTSIPYELQKKYDLQAEKIRYNNGLSWEEKKTGLDSLLSEFIKELQTL